MQRRNLVLVTVSVAALAAAALAYAFHLQPSARSTGAIVLDFKQSCNPFWFAPSGTALSVQRSSDEPMPVGLMRSARDKAAANGTTEGVHCTLSVQEVGKLAGRTVRITVVARQAPEKPSAEFAVAYSTPQQGGSNWIRFQPAASYQSFAFDYTVPPGSEANPDYLGIWADTQGGGGGILVQSVTLQPN